MPLTGAIAAAQVEAVYRRESRRVLATLIRLLGDFDRAEEALQDAFAAALMVKAGFGTAPQKALLARLGRLTGATGGPVAWLASHPATARRIAAIEALERRWGIA